MCDATPNFQIIVKYHPTVFFASNESSPVPDCESCGPLWEGNSLLIPMHVPRHTHPDIRLPQYSLTGQPSATSNIAYYTLTSNMAPSLVQPY